MVGTDDVTDFLPASIYTLCYDLAVAFSLGFCYRRENDVLVGGLITIYDEYRDDDSKMTLFPKKNIRWNEAHKELSRGVALPRWEIRGFSGS